MNENHQMIQMSMKQLVQLDFEPKEIREKINSETGAVMEKSPAHINEHEAATILFTTEPIVVEKFSFIPELGRFLLVRGRKCGRADA